MLVFDIVNRLFHNIKYHDTKRKYLITECGKVRQKGTYKFIDSEGLPKIFFCKKCI